MKIKYVCTHWGVTGNDADAFIDNVLENGYDGVEVHMPPAGAFTEQLLAKLQEVRKQRPSFAFIIPQLTDWENDTVDSFIKKTENRFKEIAEFKPDFINSHTGKDYFSFDDNCRVIEACMNMASSTNIPVYHETHRGRLAFHAATLLPYLRKFPEMKLTADFSHFCNVSESMLHGQDEILQQIMPHVAHIHARVGWEQSAQVNDPFAPEWQGHLETFTKWWQQIIALNKHQESFTICPEFGPAPYMPALPYTQQPVANQWEINVKMKNYLKEKLVVE